MLKIMFVILIAPVLFSDEEVLVSWPCGGSVRVIMQRSCHSQCLTNDLSTCTPGQLLFMV